MSKDQQQNGPAKVPEDQLPPEFRRAAPIAIVPEPKWEETEAPAPKIGRTDDIRRLATALAAAQGETDNASKDSDNPHFKTKYADLASVFDVIRLPLARHQLARTQIVNYNDSETWLDTFLIHGPSGQYISCRWPLPHKMVNSQNFMAAVTYAKRGSMMAICGIAAEDEDDDGETTAGRTTGQDETRDDQPPPESKQLREAKQWAPWAVRKIGQMTTAKDLSDWEEKFKQTLVDLKRVFPDGHADVMTAIQEADEKLSGGSSEAP